MAYKRTKTSKFGASTRECHDSKQFYSTRLYDDYEIIVESDADCDKDESQLDNSSSIVASFFEKPINFSSNTLKSIPDSSVHLIISVIIPEQNLENFENLMEKSNMSELNMLISEYKRILVNGGRLIIICHDYLAEKEEYHYKQTNVHPNLHYLVTKAIIENKLILRGNIILKFNEKTEFEDDEINDIPSKLQNKYDFAIVCCKNKMGRQKRDRKKTWEKTDTITRNQFLSYTQSVWNFEPELIAPKLKELVKINKSDKKKEVKIHLKKNKRDLKNIFKNHQFLFDYLQRFLHLYSFQEDTVLICAHDFNHHIIDYFKSIRKRIIFMIYR